jgi:hypothetical protein
MKTIIKNKRSYRTKIGRPNTLGIQDLDTVEEMGGNGEASNSVGEGNGNFSNSDEESEGPSNSGSDSEKEGAGGAGSAGTKRKATESVEKGKRRRL